jgi:hypothetical protein
MGRIKFQSCDVDMQATNSDPRICIPPVFRNRPDDPAGMLIQDQVSSSDCQSIQTEKPLCFCCKFVTFGPCFLDTHCPPVNQEHFPLRPPGNNKRRSFSASYKMSRFVSLPVFDTASPPYAYLRTGSYGDGMDPGT